MGMNWIELVSPEQLQAIRNESQESPVLIFKHSTACSISAMVLHRLQRKSSGVNVPGLKLYYLDLRAYRDVSRAVESTFEVEHESPQVLIIDKGQAVYHRSHGEIDPLQIREFLEQFPAAN
jgi:bacillithiol system protein YtxJ